MCSNSKKYGGYYDGIPQEVREMDRKMTAEELDASIEAEKKRCEQMTEWEDPMITYGWTNEYKSYL